jgi:elongator complex protein 3
VSCGCPGPSQPELHLLVCTAIVNALIDNHKAQQLAYQTNSKPPADVSLNVLRAKIAKGKGLKQLPRLMDILAAVPEEWKTALSGKITIKPIRSASGE